MAHATAQYKADTHPSSGVAFLKWSLFDVFSLMDTGATRAAASRFRSGKRQSRPCTWPGTTRYMKLKTKKNNNDETRKQKNKTATLAWCHVREMAVGTAAWHAFRKVSALFLPWHSNFRAWGSRAIAFVVGRLEAKNKTRIRMILMSPVSLQDTFARS